MTPKPNFLFSLFPLCLEFSVHVGQREGDRARLSHAVICFSNTFGRIARRRTGWPVCLVHRQFRICSSQKATFLSRPFLLNTDIFIYSKYTVHLFGCLYPQECVSVCQNSVQVLFKRQVTNSRLKVYMSRSARLTNYSHQMADVHSASGHSFNPHQLQPLLQHSDPQNQRSLWSPKLSLSRRMLSEIQWITTVDFIGKMQKETFIVLFTRLGRKLNKSLYSKTNNQIRDWDCLLM